MAEVWVLEGVAADGSHVLHVVDELPFSIGRDVGCRLVVPALGLSRRHAELTAEADGTLRITDLGSTNGTFVNRERLSAPRRLADKDIIHFGNAEFRLGRRAADELASADDPDPTLVVPHASTLAAHFVPHERQFMELLAGRGMSAAVQPIVDARTGAVLAHELLGRSTHPELAGSPSDLFGLAERLGREVDLSRAFREHGLRMLAGRTAGATLFVNAHPREVFDPGFVAGLERLPREGVQARLVVEVPETAVLDIARMRELAARLSAIDVRFAYDDFGAGRARLNELGEVPAHFVKFDMALLHGIDRAPQTKQKLVGDLVRMVHELGSVALAEGVETEAEAQVCRAAGFDLIQGFLTGRPVPVEPA